jgi:tetratricopeptide (TPR) repeat protein
MKTLILATALIAMATTAGAQAITPTPPEMMQISEVQRLFEAGQYDQALQALAQARERGEAGGSQDAFLAAHIQLRRSQTEDAKGDFTRLIESDDDTWRLVGRSSMALIDQNLDAALETATQAVAQITDRNAQAAAAAGGEAPPQDPPARVRDAAAFYQLGLVKSRREDWAGAAEAFDRSATLNPAFAYGHYYAGLMYSRLKRPDLVGAHFQTFLKLAPNAPERTSVMSIMRTLRGA